MECLAIIPARGGSEGIPNKNIQFVAGKPLLAYSVEQAIESKLISRVIVSTDDEKIGAIAQEFGAEVVWRPDEISVNTASSESALLHTLEYLEQTENYHPELISFLQCTSPLTSSKDIDGTIKSLLEENADTALAVVPFHYYLWENGEGGNAFGINHDKSVRLLRQEIEPQFLETGAIYVMRVSGFKQVKHRFFGKTSMYVMPNERRWEIDEPIDLVVAETLILQNRKQNLRQSLPTEVSVIVLDFDGVFTNNKVVVLQNGQEAVICDRGDGMGISSLNELNIPIWVLSSESNPVGKHRCEKLGIPCFYNLGMNKSETFSKLIASENINSEQAIYVGNDVNDLACMDMAGFGIAVADAHPSVLKNADYVLNHSGGDGAIRELCDLLMEILK
jgi:YrbI family 3-deoxy-D-manno-octulosonate 8-phosphate phosphatase